MGQQPEYVIAGDVLRILLQSYILSILLGRAVYDCKTAADEVILDINNYKG